MNQVRKPELIRIPCSDLATNLVVPDSNRKVCFPELLNVVLKNDLASELPSVGLALVACDIDWLKAEVRGNVADLPGKPRSAEDSNLFHG